MEITLFRNWIAARRWTFPNRITLIQFASRQRHFHSSAIQCMNRSFHLLLILCVFETLRCHKRMPEWNWFSHWVCRSGWQNQIFAEDITQFTNNYVIKINFYCHPVRQLVFFFSVPIGATARPICTMCSTKKEYCAKCFEDEGMHRVAKNMQMKKKEEE